MIPNTHNTTDEHTVIADPYAQNLMSDCEYGMMQKGFLPPFVTNWVMTSLGNIPNRVRTQIKELSNEEPYCPSTAISIVFSVIESQKSIRKWVKANLRKSYQSIPSAKKVNGKWDDAQFTLWPPYKSELSRNNTFKHVAARYVFKHDNMRVDFGIQDRQFSPVLHDNPNSALQAIATRLGRRINGDYNKIVQALCGDEYVATTTTAKVGSQWVVLVTPMRDAKITPSRFAVTESGSIINGDVHNQAASISEVEYALIKGIIDEQDDEASENYSYEFSEEFQAQFMMEANGEKMDESRMTPTELIIQGIAAENGDLIDFMVNGQVKDEYWQIVDARVEQSQKEYFSQLKLANPMGDDNALNRRALYKALYRHESEYEALEDCQAIVQSTAPVKEVFTMKGAMIDFVAPIFGIKSTLTKPVMPARNPANTTAFLPITEVYETKPKPTVINKSVNMISNASKAHFRGSWGSICVNQDGQKAVAPTKMAKPLNGKTMNPRLASIVWALDMTGSLSKARRVAKISFALVDYVINLITRWVAHTNNANLTTPNQITKMNTPLLHVRDENELRLITNVMPEKVKDAKVVFGLTMDTQVALALAAQTQTPVTTTGLPLDVASKVGTVTVIRAWDKALPGGGRSTGCQPPKLMHTMEILDEEAFKLLIESDLYRNAVHGTPAPTEEVF